MYCLIVYDVGVERVNKIHKFLRRYLNWVQNSVFEGELGEADYVAVKKKMKEMIDPERDSILLFKFADKKYMQKEVIGLERNSTETII